MPSEVLPRRRVEAYTRGEWGCQEFFFHFFNLGCLTAPQVMNTAPSRRIRKPFHFLWVPNGAPGYEYGAFQALVIAQAEGERQRTLTLSIYGEGAA